MYTNDITSTIMMMGMDGGDDDDVDQVYVQCVSPIGSREAAADVYFVLNRCRW